jgi:hypothetical protein
MVRTMGERPRPVSGLCIRASAYTALLILWGAQLWPVGTAIAGLPMPVTGWKLRQPIGLALPSTAASLDVSVTCDEYDVPIGNPLSGLYVSD